MIRDLPSLLDAIRAGLTPKYLFFWGHTPLPDGSIGKPALSQWWPSPFTIDGESYSTAEHYMMAEKARLFGDEATRGRILKVGHPSEAKKLGRLVAGFDESVWEKARFDIVVAGNLARFEQNRKLGDFLLATGERILVEASPVDRIWGIGLAADDERAADPERWNGLNLLGFALMEVRERMKDKG